VKKRDVKKQILVLEKYRKLQIQFQKHEHNKESGKIGKELSETNQTEDGTLDDQMKDGANSGVFQFTETDVNYLTVIMMMMMTKPNLVPSH
jgi:hypothetical protein